MTAVALEEDWAAGNLPESAQQKALRRFGRRAFP
jgi:hypothetical protein